MKKSLVDSGAGRRNGGSAREVAVRARAAATRVLERRTARRRPLDTEVSVVHLAEDEHSSDDSMSLACTNLSTSGIFLRSELILPQGEKLVLSFELPSGLRVVARGVVQRVELEPGRPSGMGVAFETLDRPLQRAIRLFAE
jgi:hypothetical protein